MTLVSALVSPKTKESLIEKGSFLESSSGEQFTKKGNLVNFLEKEHTNPDTDQSASFRWEHSSRLESDEGFIQHQLEDFLKRYGFNTLDHLKDYFKDVKTIAEIGAGEGRAVDWYLQYSNAHVFALELSDSVYYLEEKYRDTDRVTVIKADALFHPFAVGSIDLLSCEQSIHHTDNPREIFTSLCQSFSNNGKALLSVYAKKSPVREKFDTIIRDAIAQLNPEKKFEIAKQITSIAEILSNMDVEVRVPASYLEFGALAGEKMSLQRFFYYSVFKCFWNKDFSFEKSTEFNHDWYSYPICNKTSLEEATSWYIQNQLKIEHIDANASNINLRGGKN